MHNLFIHEVGARDGLRAEKLTVPLEEKIHWIESLLGAGIDILQLGSFVHPEKVPQMADTDLLFRHFTRNKPAGMTLSGLVLNEKGLERGLACGVDLFYMGISANETHSQKNTGMSITEALRRIVPMAKQALAAKKKVQASVQSAFGCGSSREQAASCLKGPELVIGAQHFARIFLQNSINLGLRTIICPDIEAAVSDEIDVTDQKVFNKTSGKSFDLIPLPAARQAILNAGGLIGFTR